MHRIIRALLAGSLAFGLVAASASGATFGLTLAPVVRAGTIDAVASVAFVDRVCDGTYEIFWELDGLTIVGFSAYREPVPPPDEGLAFCAGQPFALYVTDPGWAESWIWFEVSTDKFTDAQGGIVGARFLELEGIQFNDGDQVRLVIGPEAGTY